MILLLNPKSCPGCGRHALRWDQHRCGECGARVFTPECAFNKMLGDFLLSFWVYFRPRGGAFFRGWVHSSQLNNPQPNPEVLSVKAPDSSYGVRKPVNSAKFTPGQLGMEALKTASN